MVTDPTFSGPLGGGARRQFRLKTLLMAVALAGVLFRSLRVPGVAELLIAVVLVPVAGLVLLLIPMALGALGFTLVAMAERALGRVRRAASWPDD